MSEDNKKWEHEKELWDIIGRNGDELVPNFALTREELVRLADYWAEQLSIDEFYIRNAAAYVKRADIAERKRSSQRLAYFDHFLGHDTVDRIWKHHEERLHSNLEEIKRRVEAGEDPFEERSAALSRLPNSKGSQEGS